MEPLIYMRPPTTRIRSCITLASADHNLPEQQPNMLATPCERHLLRNLYILPVRATPGSRIYHYAGKAHEATEL